MSDAFDPAAMATAIRRSVAFDAAHRREVRADVEYLAAHPDGTARARVPVYRGWFLSVADVEFVPAD